VKWQLIGSKIVRRMIRRKALEPLKKMEKCKVTSQALWLIAKSLMKKD
jgi:hypothetical protein